MFTVDITISGNVKVQMTYKEACKYVKDYRRIFPKDNVHATRVSK